MQREELLFALNETTHALRFSQAAARRLDTNSHESEAGSKLTPALAYIHTRLSEAQTALSLAELEIRNLIKAISAN